jgi:hypothetical protein
MEISNSMLVAIMFVMILSIGIVNILASLASKIDYRANQGHRGICISWIVLLLLMHFNMFWHTIDILSIEAWRFVGFLYLVTGPVLIFFATDLMLPGSPQSEAHDLNEHYFLVSRRFFFILALLQLWMIGVDIVFGKGLTGSGGFNLAMFALTVTLASSQSTNLHVWGTVAVWGFFMISLTLRGLGVIV